MVVVFAVASHRLASVRARLGIRFWLPVGRYGVGGRAFLAQARASAAQV